MGSICVAIAGTSALAHHTRWTGRLQQSSAPTLTDMFGKQHKSQVLYVHMDTTCSTRLNEGCPRGRPATSMTQWYAGVGCVTKANTLRQAQQRSTCAHTRSYTIDGATQDTLWKRAIHRYRTDRAAYVRSSERQPGRTQLPPCLAASGTAAPRSRHFPPAESPPACLPACLQRHTTCSWLAPKYCCYVH